MPDYDETRDETLTVVCAWCARARQEDGSWKVALITSELWREATHGICPACFEREVHSLWLDTKEAGLVA